MAQEFRAVFLDIDGTIYFENRIVDSAVDAVRRLMENNIYVALCTGRSILHTRSVQRQLNVSHAVYFNGGLARSNTDTIASHPLEPDVVERIITFSFNHRLPIVLHSSEQTIALEEIPHRFRPIMQSYDFPLVEQVDPAEFDPRTIEIYQINMFMTQTWDQVVQNALPECLLYRWNEEAVDLQKRGCDKSHGASALLDAWNLRPEQAIHIGDGGNDIGMFQAMGMSVAMGNATPEVKSEARMITDSVDNDGVFRALRALKMI